MKFYTLKCYKRFTRKYDSIEKLKEAISEHCKSSKVSIVFLPEGGKIHRTLYLVVDEKGRAFPKYEDLEKDLKTSVEFDFEKLDDCCQ